MADSGVVMSATWESMTALATRLAYLSCFSCSTGSPLLMTGPPKETQSRKSIAVMMCPEKGAPERLYGACGLKDLAGHGRVSGKELLSGRKRAAAKPRPGTRTALYMRVSTAEQKPDLQDDDLRGYAARAGLDVVLDYCDVAVSGRREGRPQLNALMAAARNHEIDCVLVW